MKHFILAFFTIVIFTHPCRALNFSSFVRKAAKVTDNVPIHGADDVVKTFTKNKAGREAMESAAKRIVKSADPGLLKQAVKTELQAVDPALVRFADDLPKAEKEYLLVLGRGAKTCNKSIPDVLQRAKFLEKGGADTVAAVGMYGGEIAKGAIRCDAAIASGKLISPRGMRAVALADYGKLFTKYGDSANVFWTKYVVPYWKEWLLGGALAWYLIDPEGFMDTAGQLTEEGIKRLTQCAGDIAATAISGISKGLEIAVEKTGEAAGEAVQRTVVKMFTGWKPLAGSFVLIVLLGLAMPFTRYYLLKPFSFLFRRPKQ